MRLASYIPEEMIPYAFVWLDPGITPCCKTIFDPKARNIFPPQAPRMEFWFKKLLFQMLLLPISNGGPSIGRNTIHPIADVLALRFRGRRRHCTLV